MAGFSSHIWQGDHEKTDFLWRSTAFVGHLEWCDPGFELTPANSSDLEAGFELLSEHTDLEVLGDKAYIRATIAAELWKKNRIALRTVPRANQKQQVSEIFKHLHNTIHQLIEIVNGQLAGQLAIEKNFAHSFWGLCTRLYSQLTAHMLSVYLNCLLGKPDFLQIKALTFPN